MPVTAKLSREFYDRFGDKVELRDLNDQNTRRFEAKLEQLGTDLRREMADLKAELIKWMFLFWLGTVATMLGLGRVLLGG